MLKEPNFPETGYDGKSYVCLENGRYIAYLDLDAAVSLLHELFWFYTAPLGEEASIRSEIWNDIPQRGIRIGYCEFNLVPGHVIKKQGKNILRQPEPTVRNTPHGVYDPGIGRLDYFVSPEEIKVAYETLTDALENSKQSGKPQETILSDTLVVRLVLG